MSKILVVDFGSQYNQVIIKTLRKLNIDSKLVSYLEIKNHLDDVKGIILSGGPQSVYDENRYSIDNSIFDLDIPILGVCYGMQYISLYFSSIVEKTAIKEFGDTKITVDTEDKLFLNTPKVQNVFMSHNDSVTKTSDLINVIARSKDHISAIKHVSKDIYGVQFHLEVDHTPHGITMLENFCIYICGCRDTFNLEQYFIQLQEKTLNVIKDNHVLCALSGGVDSSVLATFLNNIIPNQLHCFYVDTGLMRKFEKEELLETFKSQGLDVHVIDGKKKMFSSLKDLTDPEEKRLAIGKTFIDLFEVAKKQISVQKDIKFLAQGTLYSDIIESGTSTSHTIKSHHNVGGLPSEMNFTIFEPFKELFKDEVRALGKQLNLADKIVYRQPFPGPGFGIRIIGEVTDEKVQILREATYLFNQIIEKQKTPPWQYFCVLTDTYSVGVKGDMRVYKPVLAIRAVESTDAMTASFSNIDFETLNEISSVLTNNIDGISRVVYDITSKPPGTIEWE